MSKCGKYAQIKKPCRIGPTGPQGPTGAMEPTGMAPPVPAPSVYASTFTSFNETQSTGLVAIHYIVDSSSNVKTLHIDDINFNPGTALSGTITMDDPFPLSTDLRPLYKTTQVIYVDIVGVSSTTTMSFPIVFDTDGSVSILVPQDIGFVSKVIASSFSYL